MSLNMRGSDPQRLLPRSLEDRLLGWLGRAGGIALLAGAALLWASLSTWSFSDPSLTHATANEPHNAAGWLGAILSDLLLQTLGFGAVLALLPPLIWGAAMIRNGRLDGTSIKVLFYPLAALTLAAALSAYPTPVSWPLHHGLGGALGDALFKLASNLFSLINSERADLAAGLLLHGISIASIAKSCGLDLDATMKALSEAWRLREERAAKRQAEEQETAESPEIKASWWRRTSKSDPQAVSEGLYGAASGLAVPPNAYPPPHQWTVDQRYPHLDSYMRAAEPQAQAVSGYNGRASTPPPAPYVQAPGELPFAGRYREQHDFGPSAQNARAKHAEFSAIYPDPDFAPSAEPLKYETTDGRPVQRGRSFDLNTEAASRAIAARFAPPAHEPQSKMDDGTPVSFVERATGLLARRPGAPEEPHWKRPSLNLLKRPAAAKPNQEFTQTVLRGNARLLEDVLNDFGIKGEVKDIRPGPVITLYELEPSRGTKSSRVIGLADDIARSMSVASVRAAIIPGRNAIGLELPNVRREPVFLREMLESEAYKTSDAILPLTLGKSIGGDPIVTDLARMPHLLVAGTTGSGKSVGINAFILSLLYRHAPETCRLLMIDPKMLELSVYNGIPHLLTPVVTDPQKAVAALNWAVSEMEERYKRMAALSVRNIDVFNNRVRNSKKRGEMLSRTVQTGFDKNGQAMFESQKMDLEPLPHIVIVVDEFADLMIAAGKDVEGAVQRLAQMARAAGIHLIMATQRPSVDVITGTIKANFPTRISFKVTSKVDSRTILNDQGAEQLLGQGDMLYSSGTGQTTRVHGAFVSDEEVEAIADALRQQGPPGYVLGICEAPQMSAIASGARQPSDDDLYDRAVAIVLRDRKASTSYIQRRLSVGYNRAADLIERMEREGVISPANSVGKREILAEPGGTADAA